MRKTPTTLALAFASAFLPLVVFANNPLPVQVIESTGMPGKVSAYTGIVNEINTIKASYDELQQAHNVIREEFTRTLSACQEDQKCHIVELQNAAAKLTPIAAGMKDLSIKAASLIDGPLNQLPAEIQVEGEQLKKYAKEDIIAGFQKIAQLVKESVGEQNLQIDISSLPRESQLTLNNLEAKLDDNLDELSHIVVRLDGMKSYTANLAGTKSTLEYHAVQFARNSLAVANEVSSMQRTADTLIQYGVFKGAVLTLPDIQPLQAIPRLALPYPVVPATTAPVTQKSRTLDFGAKVEAFKVMAEQINGQ